LNRILNFFDIYTSVPVEAAPNGLSCKVYPNPLTANATFRFYLAEDSQVTLDLYNSTGQRIAQPASGLQLKGEHNVQWNAEGLPAGIYYYALRTGKQASTGKIIIMK
jgi:hypothetical protein